MPVHVQTGAGINVVVEDGKLGLYPFDLQQTIWLSDPQSLVDVLAAEIQRLAPTSPSIEALCTLCGHDERFSSATGICGSRKNQDDISSGRCGCKCIFPEPVEDPRVETIRCTHCANQVAVKEEGGTSLIEAHGGCPDRLVRGNWRDDPTYQRIFPEPEDKQ